MMRPKKYSGTGPLLPEHFHVDCLAGPTVHQAWADADDDTRHATATVDEAFRFLSDTDGCWGVFVSAVVSTQDVMRALYALRDGPRGADVVLGCECSRHEGRVAMAVRGARVIIVYTDAAMAKPELVFLPGAITVMALPHDRDDGDDGFDEPSPDPRPAPRARRRRTEPTR